MPRKTPNVLPLRNSRGASLIRTHMPSAAPAAQKVRGPGLRRDPSTARAVPGLRPNRIRSVYGLAVQCEIETFALHLVAHAQPDEDVDDLEDDQRHDGVVDEDDHDAIDLVEELCRVAFDQAGGAAILLDREHP